MVIYLNIMGVLMLLAGLVVGVIERGMASFLLFTAIGVVAAIPYFVMAHVLNGLRKVNDEHISLLYERIHSLNNRVNALEATQSALIE